MRIQLDQTQNTRPLISSDARSPIFRQHQIICFGIYYTQVPPVLILIKIYLFVIFRVESRLPTLARLRVDGTIASDSPFDLSDHHSSSTSI